ncbi:hypothetical protein WBU87_12220, partial [Escherichia coli]
MAETTGWHSDQAGGIHGQGLLSYGEERICRTNELLDVICPTGRQPSILPDALHATIAALDDSLRSGAAPKELRKLTGQSTECCSSPKYGKQ